MARTYIAGYDGSSLARAAVVVVEALARAAGARALVVHVAPAVGADADRVLAGVGEGSAERRVVAAESAARGLREVAASEGATLVAVGAPGSLAPGSVGHGLLTGSPFAVLTVRDGREAWPPQRIAAAFDGRDPSRAALASAAALAQQFGARLAVLRAAEDSSEPGQAPDAGFFARLEVDVERELREALGGVGPGLDADLTVVTGPPGPGIVEAARRDEVDLLVAGTREGGAEDGAAVGSVSAYLVSNAPCSMLVVPRGGGLDLVAAPARQGD